MMKKTIFVFLAASLLLGCSTRPDTVWVKPTTSYSGDDNTFKVRTTHQHYQVEFRDDGFALTMERVVIPPSTIKMIRPHGMCLTFLNHFVNVHAKEVGKSVVPLDEGIAKIVIQEEGRPGWMTCQASAVMKWQTETEH